MPTRLVKMLISFPGRELQYTTRARDGAWKPNSRKAGGKEFPRTGSSKDWSQCVQETSVRAYSLDLAPASPAGVIFLRLVFFPSRGLRHVNQECSGLGRGGVYGGLMVGPAG